MRLRDLRHTTATLLKNLGVPPRDTMEILGRTRIAVTMEIYASADGTSRRDAINKARSASGYSLSMSVAVTVAVNRIREPAPVNAATVKVRSGKRRVS
jgi:hypothetical protein